MSVNIKAAEAVEVVSGFLDTVIEGIESLQETLEVVVENLEVKGQEVKGYSKFVSWLDEASNFAHPEPVKPTEREKNIAYLSRVFEYLRNKAEVSDELTNPWEGDLSALDDDYIEYAAALVRDSDEYKNL